MDCSPGTVLQHTMLRARAGRFGLGMDSTMSAKMMTTTGTRGGVGRRETNFRSLRATGGEAESRWGVRGRKRTRWGMVSNFLQQIPGTHRIITDKV